MSAPRREAFRRWLAPGLLAVGLVVSVIVLATTFSRVPPGPRLHDDPATVPVDSDPTAIFELYLTAASRMTSWQFVEGRRLVAELSRAGLPPELQSLVEDVNTMLVKEGSILEAADAWLREASALIESGNVDEAGPLLRQLDWYAARGNVLLDQITEGIRLLGQRANVESLPPDAPTRRAYEEVQRLAARAQALLAAYRALSKDPRSLTAASRLLPYATRIEFSLPSRVYPGKPFTIAGRLREDAPTPSRGRRVTLLLDRQKITDLRPGAFRYDLTLPAAMLPGRHLLVATVPAQGRYLRGRTERPILVTQATPELDLIRPTYAVAPGRLVVSGKATSEFGPVSGAVVQVQAGRVVGRTRTSETGEFRLALMLTGLGLVGPETLSVGLLPAEPWVASTRVDSDVFVVNLLGVGVVALVIPSVSVMVARGRRRRRKQVVPEIFAIPEGEATEPENLAGRQHAAGPRARVLAAYFEAQARVEGTVGLRMVSSMTLREFSRQASRVLTGDAFAELTVLAERVLYSTYPVTGATVEQAEELSRAVH